MNSGLHAMIDIIRSNIIEKSTSIYIRLNFGPATAALQDIRGSTLLYVSEQGICIPR